MELAGAGQRALPSAVLRADALHVVSEFFFLGPLVAWFIRVSARSFLLDFAVFPLEFLWFFVAADRGRLQRLGGEYVAGPAFLSSFTKGMRLD